MFLRLSSGSARSLVPGAALGLAAVLVASGACSGGGGASSGGGDDSGAVVETGGPDTTAHDTGTGGHDATAETGGGTETGPETSSSSGGGADAASDVVVEATYDFDGFAHADGYSEAVYCVDDDGDGWTDCGGDCNDHDSLINPCAFDTNDPTDPVGHDGIDNDCDGKVDNLITCETGLAAGHDTTPADYAHASDLCDNPKCPRLNSSIWYGTTITNAKRITGHMGTPPRFNPRQGSFLSFFSSGTAEDETDAPGYATCEGTDFGVTYTNPMPLTASQNVNPCGQGADETGVPVHDYTELRMTVKAPINAGSYSFDFAFFSEEYPVYVCQGFNDTFLAVQTSKQFPTGSQIAFDANGHRVNVNNAFFEDCNSCTNCAKDSSGTTIPFSHTCANPISTLNGTFYEVPIANSVTTLCNESHGSGGTDWLTTTSPVQPGETFTLSWVIFDEHDGILDSSVILDHFRWHSTTLGSPVTGR